MIKEHKDRNLEKLEKAYKPGLFLPIYTTSIGIAPYLHLLLDILDRNYDRLLFLTLISAPLIAYMTLIWTKYFYNMQKYKEEVQMYSSNPEGYQW